MSHELRTPLNSLLILSKLLADNADSNLSAKQIEFAQTINRAGTELLALINDILDLSKIESGTVTLDVGTVAFADVVDNLQRSFEQLASNRKLGFRIELDAGLPPAMTTEPDALASSSTHRSRSWVLSASNVRSSVEVVISRARAKSDPSASASALPVS